MTEQVSNEKSANLLNKTFVGNVDEIIDEIIKSNKLRRFAAELNHTQNVDIDRAKKLKKLVAIFGAPEKKIEDIGKLKVNEIYDKMNTQTLHWKWSKLSIPQQKNRIKEYLKIAVSNEEKRNDAEKLLFQLIETEKLKKNAVTYNTETSQVTGIFLQEYQDIIQEDDSDDSDCSDCSDNENETESDTQSEKSSDSE